MRVRVVTVTQAMNVGKRGDSSIRAGVGLGAAIASDGWELKGYRGSRWREERGGGGARKSRLEYSRAFGHITSPLADPSKHKIGISSRCSIRVRATYNDKKMHVTVAAVSKSSGERRAGSWIHGLELLVRIKAYT